MEGGKDKGKAERYAAWRGERKRGKREEQECGTEKEIGGRGRAQCT